MNWSWTSLLAVLGLAATGCRHEASVGSAGTVAGTGVDAGAAAATSTVIRHVDAAGAERLIAGGGVVVLDVRTPAEFAAGHLEGAKLIDFSAPGFATNLARLDRQQPYLLHCATGRRSTSALQVFEELGFQDVTHLDGGIRAWTGAGKPVTR
jgi:rhodanese-related sulfurtransferase